MIAPSWTVSTLARQVNESLIFTFSSVFPVAPTRRKYDVWAMTFQKIRIGRLPGGELRRCDAPMFSFRMPRDMQAALAAFAKRSGMNVSQAMREFIEAGLEAEKQKRQA